MKTLIIIESPKKIKTIKKYLGQDYTILATGGHFRELDDEVNGNGIDNNFEPVYKTIDNKQEIVNIINEQAKLATQILIATDPDREGEAIAWHVYSVLNETFKNKVKRITFNEITKEAILDAINNPKTINLDLVNAQKARQCIDKKLGYDASKFLWNYFFKEKKSKKGQKLSAGRVQSVVLLLSNQKEKEIKNFKSNTKFKVANSIDFKNSSEKLNLELKNENNEFASKHELINEFGQDLINDINFELQEVILGDEINLPALKPFRTIDALEAINKKLNIGLKQAQAILQKLYEGVTVDGEAIALITYPRTDSYIVSDKFIDEARNYIKQNYNSEILRNFKQFKNSDSAQEGHECLRIINLEISPKFLVGKIEENLVKVYELIYQRSVAIFIKSPVKQNIDFKFISQKTKNVFVANTKTLKAEGFFILGGDEQNLNSKKYEDYKKFENKKFTGLNETNIYEIISKAPSRYNQASLVNTLEKLQIGRPSTYATMLEVNLEKSFVVEKNKSLVITELGQTIIEILTKAFATLINVEFTKQMEFQLDKIAKGEIDYKEYIKQFWVFFSTILESAKQKYLR